MNYTELYTDFLASHADVTRPLKVVCDASNGTVGILLKSLSPKIINVKFLFEDDEIDPDFSAHGPNPLLPKALDEISAKVLKTKADFGAEFDGDGDRIFFVDGMGEKVPSYVIAAILFKQSKPPYVVDEIIYQTLRYMDVFSEKEIFPSRVGQVFIKKKMKEYSASMSAEFSGHFGYQDFFNCDSGLLTLIKMLSALSRQSNNLADIKKTLPIHEIANEDVKNDGKSLDIIKEKMQKGFAESAVRFEHREGISVILNEGWINVRPSNTEPLLRIYAGASSRENTLGLIEKAKMILQS